MFAKTLTKGLPLTELQLTLPLDSIESESIYGALPVLTTSFADLAYPVMLQSLPEGSVDDLRFAICSKSAWHRVMYVSPEFKRRRVSRHMKRDLQVIPPPRITMPGFLDHEGRFFAVDAFDSLPGYREWEQGKDGSDYLERAKRLDPIRQSLTTHLSSAPYFMAQTEGELLSGMQTALSDDRGTHLLVSDSNSGTEGEALTVECRTTQGRVEELWVDEGKVLGFKVWCNGELKPCAYLFSGRENSLLNTPRLIENKLVSFYYFDLGGAVYLVGREILWDERGWRTNRVKGVGIHVEKCALCGSQRWPHQNKGFCSGCVWNLPYYFKKYMPGEWIKSSKQMVNHRHAGCWNYSLLNTVRYRYASRYLIEGRENGDWRFVDEQA